MKKKIFLSVGLLSICLYTLISISFALFSDIVVFEKNKLSTANVSLSIEQKNEITIDNLSSGYEENFTYKITNYSTVDIMNRVEFDITGDLIILDYLDIYVQTIVDNDENSATIELLDFVDGNSFSSWVNDIEVNKDFEITIKIKSNNSISNDIQNKEIEFDFLVRGIENKFVSVSTQDELDSLVHGEYVILDDFNSNTININKDLYIDFNKQSFDAINIEGENINYVELRNGSTTLLDIDAVNATVFQFIDASTIKANVSTESLYIAPTLDVSNMSIELSGGKVALKTTNTVTISIVEPKENSNSVLIKTDTNTSIQSLSIAENATQNIEIENIEVIEEVDIKNPEADVVIKDAVLESNDYITYVSTNLEDVYYSTVNGTLYMNEAVAFEDAFSNQKVSKIYFEEGTYLIDDTIYVTFDVELHGIKETIFTKSKSSGYYNDYFLRVTDEVEAVINNITFIDHEDAGNGSNCIATLYDSKVTISNCVFKGYAKNAISVFQTEALIFNNEFYHYNQSGSAANAIQIDMNSTAEVYNNYIQDYISCSDSWAPASILVLRGGYANIYDNTMSNCYLGVVLTTSYDTSQYYGSSMDYSDNKFINVDIEYKIEMEYDLIVSSNEETSIVFFVDNVQYKYYTDNAYESIQDALANANSYDVIYVEEGTYNVETTNDKGVVLSNLYITKAISIIGIGEVHLTTTVSANGAGNQQQTILIEADDVLIDNLIVHETTYYNESTGKYGVNKTVEIRGGNNITIQNCTIEAPYGSGFYIGSNTTGYYEILNNIVNSASYSISINNGAGNASDKRSLIDGNEFSSVISLTGNYYYAWTLYNIVNAPIISNNKITTATASDAEGEEFEYFFRLLCLDYQEMFDNYDPLAELYNNIIDSNEVLENEIECVEVEYTFTYTDYLHDHAIDYPLEYSVFYYKVK